MLVQQQTRLLCYPVSCACGGVRMPAGGWLFYALYAACQQWWFLVICLTVWAFVLVAASFALSGREFLFPVALVTSFIGEATDWEQGCCCCWPAGLLASSAHARQAVSGTGPNSCTCLLHQPVHVKSSPSSPADNTKAEALVLLLAWLWLAATRTMWQVWTLWIVQCSTRIIPLHACCVQLCATSTPSSRP